jgi:hypothetical protein
VGDVRRSILAADLNDQGMTLIVGENPSGPFVFFAWHIYRNGNPFWIAGDASFEYGEEVVTVPTQWLRGLKFINPGPGLAERHDIGNLTIHAHSCEELHISYDFEGFGSGEVSLHRLASVQGRDCNK